MIAIEDSKPARCQSFRRRRKKRRSRPQNNKTDKVNRAISRDETCQKFKDMVTSNGYSVNKKGWITGVDFMIA